MTGEDLAEKEYEEAMRNSMEDMDDKWTPANNVCIVVEGEVGVEL